ncbi:hypothetical protein CYMTET_44853 [Cymbomonas tetramitiformis]|uniref:Right handed beta helix domain-containing protein n=1 Tax=Cymbomonas tetramitiformis TaxID=36881 RepID=A0AAE0BZE4_9CHLO|nr:hypothetical protein CYMTET_44853 [Cymbomonas tetramitiformis]
MDHSVLDGNVVRVLPQSCAFTSRRVKAQTMDADWVVHQAAAAAVQRDVEAHLGAVKVAWQVLKVVRGVVFGEVSRGRAKGGCAGEVAGVRSTGRDALPSGLQAYEGGALMVVDSEIAIDELLVLNNSAVQQRRGMVVLTSMASFTGGGMHGNFASINGGGFYLSEGADVAIEGSWFRENRADGAGGLGAAFSSVLSMRDCHVAGNRVGSYGGGWIMVDSTVLLERALFEDNCASVGGAMYLKGGSPRGAVIRSSAFNRSQSSNEGGGLAVVFGAHVNVTNSTLERSRAGTRGGGAHLNLGTQARLAHTSITALRRKYCECIKTSASSSFCSRPPTSGCCSLPCA